MPTVAEGASLTVEQLAELLAAGERHLYQPFQDAIGEPPIRAWREERARSFVDAPQRSSAIFEQDAVCAFGAWRELAWDSRHLGLRVGRIEALVAIGAYGEALRRAACVLESLLQQCRRHRMQHLSIRVDVNELAVLHAAQAAGFQIVDGIQTFCLRASEYPREFEGKSTVRPYQCEDLPGVLAIARSAYQFDRFHSDPALKAEAADALHEDWVRNSCLGSAADAVLVADNDGQVEGFLTLRMDHDLERHGGGRMATIVLVATAERARGRGVGKLLTEAAVQWAALRGAFAIQVGTQFRNVPAARLYEASGFRFIGSSLTLRALTPQA